MLAVFRQHRSRRQQLCAAKAQVQARWAMARRHAAELATGLGTLCGSPGALVLAVGVGFALERYQPVRAHPPDSLPARPAKALADVLAGLTLISTIFRMLPTE